MLGEEIFIKDKKGRILIKILENGRFLYYRYPDLTLDEKNMMIEILSSLAITKKPDDILSYLNYEGQDEFCS
jgi:hypothetical protein